MNVIWSNLLNLVTKFQIITNPIKRVIQEGAINNEQYNLSVDYTHSFTSNELSHLYTIFSVSGL